MPWEQREKAMVFSCTMGCAAYNVTATEVKLALVHASLDGKRYSWCAPTESRLRELSTREKEAKESSQRALFSRL